jgi:hypothetical protein
MRVRRLTALTVAIGATLYLALTAAIVVTPGVWLPPPLTMFTSPVPVPVLALIVAGVALQLGVTLAWARRATLRRRFVGLVAAAEVVLGVGLFLSAPVFRGSGPAPAPGSELIYATPAWMFWGLLCLALVGLLMIVAVIIHGSSSRYAADRGTAELATAYESAWQESEAEGERGLEPDDR